MAAIAIQALTKRYGRLVAVRDLDLAVESGEIFGFLGLNGAGKTTTIRILLDLVRPTTGRAAVFGARVSGAPASTSGREIGYLPGEPGFYGDMTGEADVGSCWVVSAPAPGRSRVAARALASPRARGVRSAPPHARIQHRNETEARDRPGLPADPPLLMLDEPTEGLDPLMQALFYHLSRKMRRKGRTVFMSSHVLPEVDRVCDRIGLLRDGELVLLATVQEVRGVWPARRVRVVVSTPT